MDINMSTFTTLQINNEIDNKLQTLFGIPHDNIKILSDNLFDKIQGENFFFLPKGDIYQVGYFVPKYQCQDDNHKSIYSNGDGSFDWYESIGTIDGDSPTDILIKVNSYQDLYFQNTNQLFHNTLRFFNTRNRKLGSRVSYQISLLDNFDYSDFGEPYSYFGIGGILGNISIGVSYSNFYILRYRKSTKSIDKILFIKEKSKTQYQTDFRNNDWEIANPDATNYFFTDLTSTPFETLGTIMISLVYDDVKRNTDISYSNYGLNWGYVNGSIRIIINGKELNIQPISDYTSFNNSMRIGFALRLNTDLNKVNTHDSLLKILNMCSQTTIHGISND